MSLRKQVLHYADLDYDADEISRLLHVDRRLVLQIEAHQRPRTSHANGRRTANANLTHTLY